MPDEPIAAAAAAAAAELAAIPRALLRQGRLGVVSRLERTRLVFCVESVVFARFAGKKKTALFARHKAAATLAQYTTERASPHSRVCQQSARPAPAR